MDGQIRTELQRSIPGWGSDLAPENRPGIPRENLAGREGNGAHWDQPERMVPAVKIHLTIERPELTPVFGTTCPPRGVSGRLRDVAYRLGEGDNRRWMLLMFADRVDAVESSLGELISGREPQSPQRRRLRQALFATALATGGALLAGVLLRRSAR